MLRARTLGTEIRALSRPCIPASSLCSLCTSSCPPRRELQCCQLGARLPGPPMSAAAGVAMEANALLPEVQT